MLFIEEYPVDLYKGKYPDIVRKCLGGTDEKITVVVQETRKSGKNMFLRRRLEIDRDIPVENNVYFTEIRRVDVTQEVKLSEFHFFSYEILDAVQVAWERVKIPLPEVIAETTKGKYVVYSLFSLVNGIAIDVRTDDCTECLRSCAVFLHGRN